VGPFELRTSLGRAMAFPAEFKAFAKIIPAGESSSGNGTARVIKSGLLTSRGFIDKPSMSKVSGRWVHQPGMASELGPHSSTVVPQILGPSTGCRHESERLVAGGASPFASLTITVNEDVLPSLPPLKTAWQETQKATVVKKPSNMKRRSVPFEPWSQDWPGDEGPVPNRFEAEQLWDRQITSISARSGLRRGKSVETPQRSRPAFGRTHMGQSLIRSSLAKAVMLDHACAVPEPTQAVTEKPRGKHQPLKRHLPPDIKAAWEVPGGSEYEEKCLTRASAKLGLGCLSDSWDTFDDNLASTHEDWAASGRRAEDRLFGRQLGEAAEGSEDDVKACTRMAQVGRLDSASRASARFRGARAWTSTPEDASPDDLFLEMEGAGCSQFGATSMPEVEPASPQLQGESWETSFNTKLDMDRMTFDEDCTSRLGALNSTHWGMSDSFSVNEVASKGLGLCAGGPSWDGQMSCAFTRGITC